MSNHKECLDFLLERFKIEREKFDRSGVYAYTHIRSVYLPIIQIRSKGVR